MTDPGYAHLPQDVRPLAALGMEERIAHIRAERWVQHAQADRVLGYLHEAASQPPRERMENILLVGESGMGKTMLIRKFERQLTPSYDDVSGTQRRPVVVMLMPHQPTEAQFLDQLLRALNAPSAGHFAGNSHLREPVIRLLRQLGTRVVVIDELNSVLAGTPRQQRVFLQLLRFLSNELKLAFVGVGVPEARHALFSDAQLRSRFTDVELPPWSMGEDLRDFVTRLTWSLPLREPSPVDSPKLRRLLVDRTAGITLGICKVFERAAIAAIRTGRERVDLAGLQDPEVWRGIAMPSRGAPAGLRAEGAGNRRDGSDAAGAPAAPGRVALVLDPAHGFPIRHRGASARTCHPGWPGRDGGARRGAGLPPGCCPGGRLGGGGGSRPGSGHRHAEGGCRWRRRRLDPARARVVPRLRSG